MTLWDEHRAERTERILATARKLIAEKGYEGIKMRELARESRVSVPTIYNLCGDKDQVLARAVEGQFSMLLRALGDSQKSQGVDRVINIVEGCAREMVRISNYSHAVLSVFVESGQTSGVSELIASGLTDGIEDALREMRQKRQLAQWVDERALAEQIAGHVILCAIQWQANYLSDKALPAAMVYGTAVTLLGVARGVSAKMLEERARKVQKNARAERRSL